MLRVYGKGRKERLLPLRGPVLAELRLFLSTDLPHVGRLPEPDDHLLYPTKKVYAGRGPEGQQKLAVRAYPKKRPSPQAVHRWWYRQLQAARLVGRGVTHGLNMHLARHTFATELRRVAGIDAASQALGHADLNTTLEIYGHRDGPTSRSRLRLTHVGLNSNGRTESFLPKLTTESALLSRKMEAAGIEPASAVAPNRASTSVVRA